MNTSARINALFLFIALAIIPVLFHDSHAAVKLKVGIYQNEPLIFRDTDGSVKGIYADIINNIAENEGWDLEYVDGSWQEMLEMLDNGQIDMMTATAFSEQRAGQFAFTSEPILSNWGQVYTRPGSSIESILDLDGKKIVLLSRDIYNEKFRELVDQFDIHPVYIEVDAYNEIMRMVHDAEADAGMMSRLNGHLHEKDFMVKKSPIICCPVELRIAMPKDSPLSSSIIPVLDGHIKTMKEDDTSVYYKSIGTWLGEHVREVLPYWIPWALGGGTVVIFVLVAGAVILRLQVRTRTNALEAEMLEREKSSRRFQEIFQTAPVSIWLEDMSEVKKRLDSLKASGVSDIRRYLHANPAFLEEMARMPIVIDVNKATLKLYGANSKEDLLGSLDKVFVPESYRIFKEEIIAIFNGADYFESEAINGTLDGKKIDVIISVKIPTDPADYRNMIVCITDISEQKRTETFIKNAEQQWQLTFDSITDFVAVLSPDYKILRVNKSLAQFLGKPPDELVGRYCYEEVHGITHPYPECPHIEMLKTGKTVTKELYNTKHNLHLMITASPIYEDGEIKGSVHYIKDITAKKKAEEALEKSRLRLQTIINSEPECVKILNPDGTLREMNPAGLAMIEADSLDQVVGRDICSLVAEEHRPALQALTRSVLAGNSGTLEFQVTGLKGTRKWLESYAVPLRETGDEITAVLSITRDITKQKELDIELNKLSRAVEQSPVTVVITDSNGNIGYVNPSFCRITGYSCDDVMGKNLRILKSGEHSEEFYRELWETISSGNVWKGEFQNKKKSGEIFWEEATISPVTDASGRITHYIAIKEDITERKKLEEQLLHAQKMEAIGQLAAGIAHDFNNILSAIINYAYIVNKKAPDNHNVNKGIEHIVTLANRAAHITRGILAFSRRQLFKIESVDINDMLIHMERLLSKFIGEDIILETKIPSQKLFAKVDRVQIEQAIMNLATNARDAMPEGGRLTVQAEAIDINGDFIRIHGFGKPGRYILISVTDTGTGMDEDVRQKVFDPFFTTKEVGKGTGLGLSTTYGIIRQHKGYINVYSEPAKGTTFKIYLPATMPDHAVSTSLETKNLYGKGETVLLVEDEIHVRDSIKKILIEFNYNVIEAGTGSEAIDKFNLYGKNIDLVLIDLIMPGMSGKEAIDEIRKIAPEARVIFMSGYTSDILQRKKISEKESSFISKPILPDILLERIKQNLQ